MQKEKCSHCGLNGHDSRMCEGKVCFKLFGVNILDDKSIKRRSISMGNLQSNQYAEPNYDQNHVRYFSESEGNLYSKRRRIGNGRQKVKPWTEEEHQKFLEGLEILGKGKWKRISESYVPTKTPVQVASHAQKFLLRQASGDKKTNRSSIFDMPSQKFALVPLKDSPLPAKSMTNTSSQAGISSSVMPMKQTTEIPTELPMPVPASSHGKSFVGINYLRPDYMNTPGNFGNFVTCAPIMVRPSGIPAPSPEAFQHGMFLAGPKISIAEAPLDLNK